MSRIKQLRESGKLSQKQLADMLFVNQTAVSQWERGVTTPSPSALLALCELFGTTTDYLLGRDLQGAEPRPRKKGVMVPVYGRVAAGIPIEAIEDILDYEEITEEMARAGTFFALKVQGASMSPDIKDGDVIIVRQQPDIESGEIAVVIVNGYDATVKRVKKGPEGIMLVPNNPEFEPMFYSNKEIKDLPVSIVGKVVELRRSF